VFTSFMGLMSRVGDTDHKDVLRNES
jgi:hypothetical protein